MGKKNDVPNIIDIWQLFSRKYVLLAVKAVQQSTCETEIFIHHWFLICLRCVFTTVVSVVGKWNTFH